ncbi:phage integrase [Geminocystis sp. NIES-3708]|uniref:tyrosine-type recombinase/integrase n=1 Tax=Geminocystis sp. NIES-3708 TaxID=1615909 RepID=UPI0005FC7F46|nr:tyrosine-type recombinase/integrase [Geminocystis sp. NIES-3708]BAQ61131.1 phage integrase [Geminocystis sp. NIES-3708]
MEFEIYQKTIDFKKVVGTSEPKGRALSKQEIQQIIATYDGDSPFDIRDRAILSVLRGGGLRRTELINLELRDVTLENSELYIRNSKGNKSRKIFLPDEALFFIKQWLELRGYENGYLFCRIHRGGHLKIGQMHSNSIWRMLQKRAKLAKIESCCSHDLRQTFCGDLLSAGVDIVTVQKLADHASPITTASYDRRENDIKRKVVQNLSF